MRKINYQLESWICSYESNARTIEELENYYKANPYKHIKERIILCLDKQKELLMKINSCGFSKYFFDTFKLNRKYKNVSRELTMINKQTKVVKSRKATKLTYRYATSLLITSLLICAPSGLSKEHSSGIYVSSEVIEKLIDDNLHIQEKYEEQVIASIESQPEVNLKAMEPSNQYYDIECTEEFQDYFYELEEKWGVPASVAMLIVDQESDGHWNTNGVISRTNDYGLSQINICNHQNIFDVLGYTSDDLKNDPYKNLDAMFYLLSNIFNLYDYTKDNYDIENVCGTYNGYIRWRDKEQSVNYVSECMERYDAIFVENQDEEKLLIKNYSK